MSVADSRIIENERGILSFLINPYSSSNIIQGKTQTTVSANVMIYHSIMSWLVCFQPVVRRDFSLTRIDIVGNVNIVDIVDTVVIVETIY